MEQQEQPLNPLLFSRSKNLIKEKWNKLWISLCIIIMLFISAIAFIVLFRIDIYTYYGLKSVIAYRDCVGIDCKMIPQVKMIEEKFSIPIKNVTLDMVFRSKGGNVWHYYFGNVSSDDFCLSNSMELALDCFHSSFPNNQSDVGNLFYLKSDNPLFTKIKMERNSIFLVDNHLYRVKFVNPNLEKKINFESNMTTVIISLMIFMSFPIGLLIASFFLKGKNWKDKFFGVYSFSNEESEMIHQNSEIVNSFNGRVIIQEVYLKSHTLHDPEKLSLYKHVNTQSNVQFQENNGKKLCRDSLSTLMKQDEEILSYEILSPNFTTLVGDYSQRWKEPIMLLLYLFIMILVVIPIILIVLFIFDFISPSILMVICSIYIPIRIFKMKMPTAVHYILTNRQFIVIEQCMNCIRVYSIELRNISNIWSRVVVWKYGGDDLKVDRNELIAEIGGEFYNRGVLAVNVTDPDFYIDTINRLKNDQQD